MPEPAQPGLIRPAQRGRPDRSRAPERVAVVAPMPGDDDVTVGLAAGQVIRTYELEGRLDGLGTARDRVDRRIVHRQHRREFGGVGLQRLGRERAAVGVGETAGLARHDRRDLRAPMTDVDDDRPAGGIEVLPPGRVADGRSGRLHRDWRRVDRRTPEDPTARGRADGPRLTISIAGSCGARARRTLPRSRGRRPPLP